MMRESTMEMIRPPMTVMARISDPPKRRREGPPKNGGQASGEGTGDSGWWLVVGGKWMVGRREDSGRDEGTRG
jgi:hypothetical protein